MGIPQSYRDSIKADLCHEYDSLNRGRKEPLNETSQEYFAERSKYVEDALRIWEAELAQKDPEFLQKEGMPRTSGLAKRILHALIPGKRNKKD